MVKIVAVFSVRETSVCCSATVKMQYGPGKGGVTMYFLLILGSLRCHALSLILLAEKEEQER